MHSRICLTHVAFILVFLCFCMTGGRAAAQVTGLGTISGTVTDPSGAVIVGASITIRNTTTNVTQSSVTNKTGYFEVDALNLGSYVVTVSAPGFENLVRQGITLLADARVSIPLVLKAGQVTQTVTVNEDVSLLNTESGSEGQVLTTKQIESLPVNGSNSFQFMEIAPGIQSENSQTYSMDGTLMWPGVVNFGAAGIIGVNEFSLDGAPNESGRANAINMAVDEVGEQKEDTSGFDASVGHTMGVQITQTTKSGTNDLHGVLRGVYQNRRWAAMQHFQGLNYRHQQYVDGCVDGPSTSAKCFLDENLFGQPGVHENNDGFAVGGPVYIPWLYDGRNKFFWFTSYDSDIFSDAGANTITIPTVQERSGDFSDLPLQTTGIPDAFASVCGTGAPYYGQYQIYNPYSVVWDASTSNSIPRRQPVCGNNLATAGLLNNNTMAKMYNGLMPTPTNSNTTGSNYQYEALQPMTFRQFTQRFDYSINQNNHVFFRWSRAVYSKIGDGFTVGDVDYSQEGRWIDTGALDYDHVFSSNTNLDITVGATSFKGNCCQRPGENVYKPSDFGLPGYADTYGAQATGNMMPQFQISNYQQLGNMDNAASVVRTLAVRANLTHVQGRHTIRSGFEWRQQNYSREPQGNLNGVYSFDNTYTQENNGTDPTFSQNNTGLSYAAFLMGVQSNSSVSYQTGESVHTPYYAAYIGDTWRITPKLTLIPGIRFEYEFGPVEKYNRQIVGWDATAALPISAPANTAYQAVLASATPAEANVLPRSLVIQGGPLYAGVNGAPTNQFNNSYRFMPRLAAAYQVRPDTVVRVGYGLFFDTLNALEQGGSPGSGAPGTPGSLMISNWSTNQDGFDAGTGVPSSTTYGTNFSQGAPPILDPFPANASGNRFNEPIGSAAGTMYYVGQSPTIYDHNLVPAREQRGELSVQHQFGSSTMVEVAWVASFVSNVPISKSYSYTPAQFFTDWQGMQPNFTTNQLLSSQVTNPFQLANFSSIATSNPAAYNMMSLEGFFTSATTSVGSLVHANPQGGLSQYQSMGKSKFQELQINVTRRFEKGFSLMAAYQLNYQRDRDWFRNGFDPYPSWELSNNSMPYRFTAEGVYELPFGRDHQWANSGWKSAVFGGFQLNATYEVSPGALIPFGSEWFIGNITGSNIKLKNPVYHNDIVGGNNYVQWLNVGNVATAYNNGTCTYSGQGFVTSPPGQCQPNYNLTQFPPFVAGVRAKGPNQVQMSVQRTFHIWDRVGLETRFEGYNIFNRQVFSAFPDTAPWDPQFGQINGDGASNGSGNARWIDISGKIRF